LAFSNPLTCLDFMRQVKIKKCKSVIQTAASGSLGCMFIKLCNENDIDLINIVKGKTAMRELKELGAK